MNRITGSIDKMKELVKEQITRGLTTQAKVDELHKTLDMSLEEFVRFQELKTLAVAERLLTQEEGQTVYALLGTLPETFNAQPVEVKSVLTKLFGELLGRRLAGVR